MPPQIWTRIPSVIGRYIARALNRCKSRIECVFAVTPQEAVGNVVGTVGQSDVNTLGAHGRRVVHNDYCMGDGSQSEFGSSQDSAHIERPPSPPSHREVANRTHNNDAMRTPTHRALLEKSPSQGVRSSRLTG